jgi:SAM-dependent methyltransferase
MDPGYYSKYYHFERTHWWFTVRSGIISTIITERVNPDPDSLILNVGAATGASSEWLKKFGRVVSLESDPNTCRFLREELKVEVTEGSITQLPFPDKHFDLVCAFDVLEHVEEDVAAMQELNRVLNIGGTLIVTVPAFRFLWSRHDVVNHHKRRYTLSTLRRKLEASGLIISYASYFNSLLFVPIAVFRLLNRFNGKKKNLRSDFESSLSSHDFLNRIFKGIFGLERKMLKYIRFPAGVSIIVVAKKR